MEKRLLFDRAPVSVMAGAMALTTSAGLFSINAIPVFSLSQYSGYPLTAVILTVIVFSVFSVVAISVPLLCAFFIFRGHRWPLFVATGFAILTMIGVVDAALTFIAGAIAGAVGAVLLWLPSAREYGRAAQRERRSRRGLIEPRQSARS
ncbi:hypothetical protein AVP42_00325 [Agromyces sp. NDB4Y10]|uniref:Major facilitator superfamily (MFS) profile domain-containing protein n=1 Tax=Agromyces indicus TaxID=758919 RepID=A0ABU1FPC3_9MICO|nr:MULTISPECIES: hypothetical protein [Agromyces]KZE95565.1 hypothetical protein AVP42_00325 [Agromyces sp. NDB4Y10]MDR5693609.1 hypothetical protein [Agromyces indicus]